MRIPRRSIHPSTVLTSSTVHSSEIFEPTEMPLTRQGKKALTDRSTEGIKRSTRRLRHRGPLNSQPVAVARDGAMPGHGNVRSTMAVIESGRSDT